ncbi:hypothetical protein D3C74_339470 [compost metagenome]
MPRTGHGVPDELRRGEGRAQPVLDVEAVPHRGGGHLDHADPEHDRGPAQQDCAEALAQSFVEGSAEHVGHDGLAPERDHAEQDGDREDAPLAAGEPPEEGARAGERRGARVGEGEGSHGH